METIKNAKPEVKKEKDAPTAKAVVKKASQKEDPKERKTKTKEKNFIYRFQVDEKGLTDKEQKKRRNKLRRQMTNLLNAVIIEKKDPATPIKAFLSFYKKEYLLNDFSIESISASGDEDKQSDIKRVLDLAKASMEKK